MEYEQQARSIQKKLREKETATFCERVDRFWNWFLLNEQRLAGLVESRGSVETDTIIMTFSEGTNQICKGLHFHVGGDYEFTFAVSGKDYLFYLLPYVIARKPQTLQHDWKFYPYMQSAQGQDFTIRMNDVSASASGVQVGMEYNEQRNSFALRFWGESLQEAEPQLAFTIFYLLMEHSIGEGASHIFIEDVQRAAAPEEGFFPLNRLEEQMRKAIGDAGKEFYTLPSERYTLYELEPEKDGEPRFDVIFGTTCFTGLVGDYYEDDATNADGFLSCGAKAVYLCFPTAGRDGQKVLDLRHQLQDRLEAEVLGERGSGRELGILLGGAIGNERAYIDLLVYDEKAFQEKLKQLSGWGEEFSIGEFKRHSPLRPLASK